ncbi:hypothetical protein NC651_011320 [Populus alba x Populus x berolinensis]|nr:hypothetical protein NC651_011320 [Populus alba x Populus x berolinensis]
MLVTHSRCSYAVLRHGRHWKARQLCPLVVAFLCTRAQLISYPTELILFGKCCIVGQDFDLPIEFLRTHAFTAGLDKHRAHRIDIGPFQIWTLLNRKQRFIMKNKGSREWKPARSAVNLIKISASDVEKTVISQSGNLLSLLCSPFDTT